MNGLPHTSLLEVLLNAYAPCPAFGSCPQANWHPSSGFVPRGFLGACAKLSDVKAILIFSEPSSPDIYDDYSTCKTSMEYLKQTISETYRHFENPTHQIHRNTRWFLDQIWPEKSFSDQLKHVWLTEGRLCSIDNKIGNVPDRQCSDRYLKPQLDLLPNALVIPFGAKPRKRISKLNVPYLDSIYSLSPPGANHTPARPSWIFAAQQVRDLQ